jgi:hypothetical protein
MDAAAATRTSVISTARVNQRMNARVALANHSFNPTGPENAHDTKQCDDGMTGGQVTYEGNTRVGAASLLNAEQHAGEAAQAIFSQTRYVNAVTARDAQALVRGVAAGTSRAVEEKEVGGGREHAARAGHVAVAADDGDARHPDATKPIQLFS